MKLISTALFATFIVLLPPIGMSQDVYGSKEVTVDATSFIELIANPERYNDRKISVMGYLFAERDRTLLFLDERGYKNYDLASAIDLPVPSAQKEVPLPDFNLRNVEVVGVFKYIRRKERAERFLLRIQYIRVRPD